MVEVGARSEAQVKGKSEAIGLYEIIACWAAGGDVAIEHSLNLPWS